MICLETQFGGARSSAVFIMAKGRNYNTVIEWLESYGLTYIETDGIDTVESQAEQIIQAYGLMPL